MPGAGYGVVRFGRWSPAAGAQNVERVQSARGNAPAGVVSVGGEHVAARRRCRRWKR